MLRIVPHAGPCRNYILSPERLQTKTGPFSGTGKHLRMFGQRMVMVVAISNRGRCAQGNGIGHGVQRQSQDDAATSITECCFNSMVERMMETQSRSADTRTHSHLRPRSRAQW